MEQQVVRPHRGKYEVLPTKFLELIGEVTSEWAIVERGVETALARLALAPDFHALALTNDLTVNNRLRAMKNLIDMHQRRYVPPQFNKAALQQLTILGNQIGTKKEMRNKIAHWVWTRRDDHTIFGQRFMGKQPHHPETGKEPYMLLTEDDLAKFLADVIELSDQLWAVVLQLPEQDERHALRGKPIQESL